MTQPLVVKSRSFGLSVNSFWQWPSWLTRVAFAMGLFPTLLSAESLPLPDSADWGVATYSFAGSAAAIASNQDSFLTNPAGLIYYRGLGA